jgi:hypothetical protein
MTDNDRIFAYAWVGVLIIGYVAYLRGFSPSPLLCMTMIVPGAFWVLVFLSVTGVPLTRIASLTAQQYGLLICILVSIAPASSYALGWLYTVSLGVRSAPALQVTDKQTLCPRNFNCFYFIRLKDAELIPTYYMVTKQQWSSLEVGKPVYVSEIRTIWGRDINIIGHPN